VVVGSFFAGCLELEEWPMRHAPLSASCPLWVTLLATLAYKIGYAGAFVPSGATALLPAFFIIKKKEGICAGNTHN